MAEFHAITDSFLAAPQLTPDDFGRAQAMGVRLIVNNRPDGEAPGQLSGDEAQAAAERAGLAYAHVPVPVGGLDAARVEAMEVALGGADGKVLAYCASGIRSAAVWALAEAKSGREPDALLAALRNAGIDLEQLRPSLEALSRSAGRN